MTQSNDDELTVERYGSRARRWVARQPRLRAAAIFCVYGASYYLAYHFGMSFSHATASPFWFPDSVLLCALLLAPTHWWWAFVLGTLPIRLAFPGVLDLPFWFLLSTFLVDAAKGVVTALALRRFLSDPLHLRSVRDLAFYFLIAVVLVPATAAFGGAGARLLLGHDYWTSWEQWFLGNVLANLVVTPAILYGILGAPRALATLRANRGIEGLLVTIGLVVTGYAAFQAVPDAGGFAEPRFYAPVPFLFWAALRFGMFGASVAVVLITVIAVDAALAGQGPFAGLSPAGTALALQHFLLLRAPPLYLVAILFEQKQAAEEDLIKSERRYREVVESQTELVCRFLPDGALSFANEAFCRTFERRREAVLGSDFVALLPEVVRDVARAQIKLAASHGERGEWECQATRPEGNVAWQHWLCRAVVGPRGGIEEFQAIGHDVTDRKRAEEANRNLMHASRLAALGELTAMVAHEVNQPLGAILSNADAAEMLLDSKDPPLGEIRQILSDIRKSDLRASEAILRVRALLRKQEIRLQPIDLNGAIVEVLSLTAGELQRRDVPVRNDLATDLPPVSGDQIHLQQVLLNLIVNAMDAMRDTPVADRLLVVGTRRNGPHSVEVVVGDRGQGIAPEELPRIFESFFSTKHDGMGLGLSISRSIVESHRGRIWAENQAGGGAAFHFTVKIAHGEIA